MIEVIRYNPDLKEEWDEFVKNADNSSFLFLRDYMDYHSDRFTDMSLMLYEKGKLNALLPGNINGNHFYSHQGLTFGSVIHNILFTYEKAKLYFETLISFLTSKGLKNITIKTQPFFYTSTLSQVQTHVFETLGCNMQRQDIGAFINCNTHTFPKSTVEKRKLNLDSFYVDANAPLEEFWEMLELNLKEQHLSKPVHTLAEIKTLLDRFPDNIKLFCIRNISSNRIDAGTLFFDNGEITKMQYIATSTEGRTNRATHAFYYLFITEYKKNKKFIDMGTCMTGNTINSSLLYLKQRFGANIYSSKTFNK